MIKQEIFLMFKQAIANYDETITCIVADQNAPAPNGTYVAIRVFENYKTLSASIPINKNLPNDLLQTDYIQQVEFTLNIESFRTGAFEVCSHLSRIVDIDSFNFKLHTLNLGWGGTSEVLNLTALQSTEMEERATIKIKLYGNHTITETSTTIDVLKTNFISKGI